MAAPVKLDQELELRVDSLAYGGNGVARLNGFVVFVRRGLPGDTVRARVTKVKRSHAEALAVEVVEPGPERVDAPCAHYPACGGCRFQDLEYEAQTRAKEAQVADAFRRLGGIPDAPLEPIVPADSPFFYRNKLEYSFTQTPSGPTLGFHKAGRWDEVLEVEKCWLTTDVGNDVRNAVRAWAQEEGLEAYDQEEQKGYLRHLVYREGRNTGQVLVQLVTGPGERFETGYFVEVLRRFPEVRSIHWAVNDTPAEVTNLPTRLLWGEEAIEEELCGLRFRVRPGAFLQTNTAMAERLYALAIEYAALTGGETVWDLYCGIGTIGLAMASNALTVWGIEVSEESVACAIENAELNGITNAAFYAGNVGQVVEELLERSGQPDVVVVDPPRAGLAGKALRRLGRIGAPRIVYVSCNPTTLASDVKQLGADWGYRLVRARPVDMFPHTPHVETVALLERDADAPPPDAA
ncbi:MAG TPA: 23S rRNA (uracil(1939)-C(5))-methyltransferase RlmD [Gaiellaceae bacterium]|jgi:23S rRNA (uracil1939-C5)-methyltransferase|nr:23S rRNA (uracil(1939)-C(5))-methyltransferase RlmD [Gaiellaceae bacterium]